MAQVQNVLVGYNNTLLKIIKTENTRRFMLFKI